MPVYAYSAITTSGSLREKTIDAASASQARMQLRARGERVIRIKELAGEQAAKVKCSGGKKPSQDEVASTIRQMSILIRAGVPLVEGLQGLGEQSKSPVLRACMEMIARDVSQGSSLSDAFERHPSIFPTLAIEMAKVAEAGSNLPEAMAKLADYMESGAEISRKVKSALAYPIVVICISVATVIVMVTFILPRFHDAF